MLYTSGLLVDTHKIFSKLHLCPEATEIYTHPTLLVDTPVINLKILCGFILELSHLQTVHLSVH